MARRQKKQATDTTVVAAPPPPERQKFPGSPVFTVENIAECLAAHGDGTFELDAETSAAEEAASAAAEEEGEGQRRTSDRPNTMALGSYRESVAGTQATRFEKTEDQLHQKIKQLKTALYQQDKTSIADIVAVFRGFRV